MTTLGLTKYFDSVIKQFSKRAGTRCTTSKSLKRRSGWPDVRIVDMRNLARVQQRQKLMKARGPTDFRVWDHNSGRAGEELVGYLRQLLDVLTLYRISNAGTTAENIQNLRERL